MASVIKNVISTIFTTSGADAAEGATDRFGRAQTRLGNASAGAGRSFAAQSSGLGGLVGAYAAAAATVFALQAGFTALANAARVEQTFAGLNSLAANVGASGTQVLNSVRELTNNQLTLAEAASQTSLAFSAGFNTSQIENLTVVALKASRALGRDLSDSMTRVIRGSSKMETELLDELGIYTKIEPATRAYAAAIGKSVGSLSEFERRQAFANAVIAEGQRKFSSINTTIPTTAEQIEAFGVKIVDLTTQLGMLLADTLAPLATFLTNNVAAAFGVLGLAISMAAGKGIQLLSAGFQSMTASIVAAGLTAENFVRKITGVQAAAITATAAIKTLDAATLRLNDAEKARLAGIQTSASTRNLSKAEIKDSNALINKSITAIRAEVASENTRRDAILSTLNASGAALKVRDDEFKAARTNLQTLQQQGAGTAAITAAKSQLASAQGRLGAATAAFNKVQNNNLTTLAATRTTTLGLNADIAKLNTTLAATIPAATGARAAIAGFLAGSAKVVASVSAGFTGLFTGIIGGASKIFFLTSIITLIGSSFANAIGKGEEFQALLTDIGSVFKGLFTNDAAKKAKSALQGITAANLANLEKTDAKLRNTDSFTFKKKILGFEVDVTKTKAELASEVTNLLSQASQGYEKEFIKDSVTSGKAIGGAIAGNLLGPLLSFIPGIGPLIGPLLGRTIGTAIGTALGSIWDYFTEIPDLPKALSDRIKSQFADSLSGLDVEVQDKLVNVLASLEKKYGAAARFDPSARAALKTQQQLVLEGGKYLNDIEAVSELMLATGQTADKLVKNFKFDEGERQISYISQAFTELANKKFTFTFIDIQDEALQKLINTDLSVNIRANEFKLNPDIIAAFNPDNLISTSLQTSFGDIDTFADNVQAAIVSIQTQAANAGVSIEEFLIPTGMETIIEGLTTVGLDLKTLAATSSTTAITIRKPIEEATGAYNSYQQASIRALEVQRQLGTSLADGTATLESFTQGLSNSKSAIIEGEQGYYAVVEQITILKASLADLERTNPELAAGLRAFIVQLEAGVVQSEKNLANQREITKEYAAQEAILKNQLTISGFFKSFTKEAKNPLMLELEFASIGSENVLATQIGYLSQFVTATEQEVQKYNELKSEIKTLSLSEDLQQKILTTPLADAKELADELNDASIGFNAILTSTGIILTTNVDKGLNQATAKLDLLKGNSASLVAISEDAAKAINEIVRQSGENLPQYIEQKTIEIKKLAADSLAEVKKLAQEDIILAIKFEVDLGQLKRELSIIQQESIIEQLSLSIDLTKAKVDAGKLTKAEGVSEETRIRQQLLQEERYLIGEQFVNESMAIEDRRTLMIAESESRINAISAQGAAQKAKLKQDSDYVSTIAAVYKANIEGLDKSADILVDGIVVAGNNVSDSWKETLRTGAIALNSAIISGLAKSTQFDSTVTGASAQAVNLDTAPTESIVEAAAGFAETTAKAEMDVTLATIANIMKEIRERTRGEALLDQELTNAEAKYNAAIAAADLGEEIEAYKAMAAAQDAAGKAAEKLTGRLADLKSSIDSSVNSALMGINDAIINGTEENKTALEVLRDAVASIFISIQEEVFKQTIANPISDMISSWLVGGIKQLNLTDIRGSSLAGVLGSARGATGEKALAKNVMGDKAVEAGAKFFKSAEEKISTGISSLGTGVNAAAGAGASAVSGAAGVLATTTATSTGAVAAANTAGATTLMSSLGPILAVLAVIAAIGGLFNGKKSKSASQMSSTITTTTSPIATDAARSVPANLNSAPTAINSMPKMAIGGLRDRVPTMLEPGEFVIRKPMVNRIGTPALESLNATGAMPNAAPIINIKNEGSPKDATASPPRFDGEKYVIDIVMRDLANNGPIRKSLRGGAV